MAKNFIIHIPEVGQDHVYWGLADDRGSLLSGPETGTLAEAAKDVEGRRTTVVLPGDNVLLADASVPGGSATRAVQAVPALLEEQVADDIEKLHFSIGSRIGNDRFPVAVIDKASMDIVSEQLEEARIRPSEIVPETLAIPKLESQDKLPVWTALVDQERAVVRLNGFKGFAADTDTAEFILDGARRELEDEQSQGLIIFRTEGTTEQPQVRDLQVESRDCETPLHVFAAGLAKSPRINLLQGDYSFRQQLDQAWKPWRWTLVLAAILLAALGGSDIVDYFRLGQQENQLQQQLEQTFSEAIPNVPMRGNGVAQMRERLRRIGEAGNDEGFTVSLGHIARSMSVVESEVHAIGYREGRFDLDISVDAVPSLDKLKQEIEKSGSLKMEVQSTNRKGESVRSRIRVEAQ